ncbi:MAG TPA: translation elongation factor 4, partial [Phaeodactylibacter sp.]|nr:translation elongation factor 4 [Phaeodactylibacter sp.]
MKNIRNFCVIAHIDHGKSTLSDRLLEYTKTIADREMQDQALDNMDLERERGITIKSHAIQMYYDRPSDNETYTFNLIDTPGHVDFSYEVSRSIAACEGALLLVDASQGIQAQTISNLYLAIEHDLEIIPILNKVDMESAMVDEVSEQIIDLIGCELEDIILASGKTGQGVPDIMEAIVNRIPAPKGDPEAPLQALIFDSVFNPYRGVVAYFRILNGSLHKGEMVRFVNTGKEYEADEIGVLRMTQEPHKKLSAGNVGYIITGIKDSKEIKVGDTITSVEQPGPAIRGFEDVKPMVFAGIFPLDNDDFEDLRDSLEKLQLNDASLVYEPETSAALGFGFRCGFLGMLHLEIVQERLFREFDMDVITTVPNVSYNVLTKKGEELVVRTPSELPEVNDIDYVEEPYINAQIITKPDYIGAIMTLCMEKRGILTKQHYLTPDRVELSFDLPLAEIVFDFYDRLKSVSRGYA